MDKKKLRKMSYDELLAIAGKTNPLKGRPFHLDAHRTRADDKKPLPPHILADAMTGVCHKEIGKGRAAKSVKVRMKDKPIKFEFPTRTSLGHLPWCPWQIDNDLGKPILRDCTCQPKKRRKRRGKK